MFSVGSSFRIPVPIGRVWRLLIDIERYRDWHPALRVFLLWGIIAVVLDVPMPTVQRPLSPRS